MNPPLQAQARLKELLAAYYRGLAKDENPVAWCTSVGPAELLRAFGFAVYFPENHGALIGTRRLAGRYIPHAAREGFSPDICSYLTSDIGAFLTGETPLKESGLEALPRPRVLVYNTSQCREVQEWFNFYGERYQVPVLGINTPRNLDDLTPSLLGYLKASWEELILRLEGIASRKLDEAELRRIVERSHEACALWQKFLGSNAGAAARHTFFDHVFLMAPVVVLRGTEEACAFYRELLDEVAAIPREAPGSRRRIYWEGMPVWGKIRFFADFFDRHGVDVTASTYCDSWTFDFGGSEPLAAMARAYAAIFIVRSQDYKLNYLKEQASKFGIDAFLFHDAKTCPYNTNSRFGLPKKLQEATGAPSLTFYGDLSDLRHFSEEEFTLRAEAFLEQLA